VDLARKVKPEATKFCLVKAVDIGPDVLTIPTRTALPLATTSTQLSQPQIPTTGLQYVDDQLVYVKFHAMGGFSRGNMLTLRYDSLGRPVLPWTPQ
jgi:hypothetical protein